MLSRHHRKDQSVDPILRLPPSHIALPNQTVPPFPQLLNSPRKHHRRSERLGKPGQRCTTTVASPSNNNSFARVATLVEVHDFLGPLIRRADTTIRRMAALSPLTFP